MSLKNKLIAGISKKVGSPSPSFAGFDNVEMSAAVLDEIPPVKSFVNKVVNEPNLNSKQLYNDFTEAVENAAEVEGISLDDLDNYGIDVDRLYDDTAWEAADYAAENLDKFTADQFDHLADVLDDIDPDLGKDILVLAKKKRFIDEYMADGYTRQEAEELFQMQEMMGVNTGGVQYANRSKLIGMVLGRGKGAVTEGVKSLKDAIKIMDKEGSDSLSGETAIRTAIWDLLRNEEMTVVEIKNLIEDNARRPDESFFRWHYPIDDLINENKDNPAKIVKMFGGGREILTEPRFKSFFHPRFDKELIEKLENYFDNLDTAKTGGASGQDADDLASMWDSMGVNTGGYMNKGRKVPVKLTRGEIVLPPHVTQKNLAMLEKMNEIGLQARAAGGVAAYRSQGGMLRYAQKGGFMDWAKDNNEAIGQLGQFLYRTGQNDKNAIDAFKASDTNKSGDAKDRATALKESIDAAVKAKQYIDQGANTILDYRAKNYTSLLQEATNKLTEGLDPTNIVSTLLIGKELVGSDRAAAIEQILFEKYGGSQNWNAYQLYLQEVRLLELKARALVKGGSISDAEAKAAADTIVTGQADAATTKLQLDTVIQRNQRSLENEGINYTSSAAGSKVPGNPYVAKTDGNEGGGSESSLIETATGTAGATGDVLTDAATDAVAWVDNILGGVLKPKDGSDVLKMTSDFNIQDMTVEQARALVKTLADSGATRIVLAGTDQPIDMHLVIGALNRRIEELGGTE